MRGLSVTGLCGKKALMSHKSQQLRPRFKEGALSKGANKTWIASADLHLIFILMLETLPVMQQDGNGRRETRLSAEMAWADLAEMILSRREHFLIVLNGLQAAV